MTMPENQSHELFFLISYTMHLLPSIVRRVVGSCTCSIKPDTINACCVHAKELAAVLASYLVRAENRIKQGDHGNSCE